MSVFMAQVLNVRRLLVGFRKDPFGSGIVYFIY